MIIIILSAAAITESCRGNRWGRALQNTVTDWSHAQKAPSSFWWVQGGGRRLWPVTIYTIYTIWSSKHQRNVETCCCHPLQTSLLFATARSLLFLDDPLIQVCTFSINFHQGKPLYHKSNFKFSNEDCQCQTLGGGAQGYNGIQSISHDQHLQCQVQLTSGLPLKVSSSPIQLLRLPLCLFCFSCDPGRKSCTSQLSQSWTQVTQDFQATPVPNPWKAYKTGATELQEVLLQLWRGHEIGDHNFQSKQSKMHLQQPSKVARTVWHAWEPNQKDAKSLAAQEESVTRMWHVGDQNSIQTKGKKSTQPPPGVIIFYNRSPNASMSKFARYSSYKYSAKVTNHLSHQLVWC